MLALCLALSSSILTNVESAPVPSLVEEAVARAVTVSGARADIRSFKPSLPFACTPLRANVPPVASSGQLAVRLFGRLPDGKPCDGWAWVRVSVFTKAWVTRQAIDVGDAISDAVVSAEKEVVAGRPLLQLLPQDSVAAMPLGPNVALEPAHVREKTPELGQPVTVQIKSGALVVEQEARWAACSKKMACALLPNGQRIQGRWNGQLIVVEQQ